MNPGAIVAAASVDPGGLQSWDSLAGMGLLFAAAVAVLAFVGRRRGETDWLFWIPRGMRAVTGIPGWAGSMVGTAAFGLLVAGVGFYNDVAWHVAIGRDEELFTAPHTMIVVGLQLLVVAGGIGVFLATLERVPDTWMFRGLHVPRSAAAMLVVGAVAVSGFPLDELWHQQFGIDVTMWSPTHLLMIVGASLTPIVSWLALAEAGVRPQDSAWARGVYVVVALLVLDGLSSVQGEFDFGVPQFQALYLPVLLLLAGSLALVAVRLNHGPGWTFLVVGLMLLTRFALGGDQPADLELHYRPSALYVGSALAVEGAAWWLGTERRTRFLLASAAGVATLGLAVEWWWNQGAAQPWRAALLPEAVLVGGLAALGGVALGSALGDLGQLRRPRLAPRVLAAAGLAVLVALAWPFPRRTGSVTADVALETAALGEAFVVAELDPPDAADGARWFQASAWQGGGLRIAEMVEEAPGRWRSEAPVPISGPWKTLLRLHRGAEMMAVPLYLPADPEIDEPEIPAVDKVSEFEKEQRYLLREQEPGSAVFAWGIPALALGGAALAAGSFVVTGRGVARRDRISEPSPSPRTSAPAGG